VEEIVVQLKDYSMLRVTCSSGIAAELSDYFCFDVPGAKYMPAFKRKVWDGKIRLFNNMNGEINAGLFAQIAKFCKTRGYSLQAHTTAYGSPTDRNDVNHMKMMQWIPTIGVPFLPRDYQYDAIVHAITHKRCLLVSPTGSGKSFIIYLILRWFLENNDTKALIVVPTTGLVEQMYKDFEDYGFNSSDNCHRIYSGQDKDTDKRVVISTWQSINKLTKNWFSEFGAIFGDECHGFKAKSLSSIMNKSVDAEYRFGTTGTLDGTQTNELVLEGLFGPVHKVTTTKKLQDSETLAKLDINILVLRYPKEVREEFGENRTYQEEIDFIVSRESRNKFITNLALDLKGNSLVLFNLVDKHGKVLYNMLFDKIDSGRKLFYVSGETKTSDREEIRHIVEKQSNSVILASLGTFSTGVNIRNIHNIIFASPSKSQIRVLQSIGRGLRMSDDGRPTRLFDLSDDLGLNSSKNFTLLHSFERVKIYNKEEFPYVITPVELV
jgi:superfamily II DNA or RNA helicase